MSIIEQLSSQVGDRTATANMRVVRQCIENPDLLIEIAAELHSEDAMLAGDCAEVMTEVAASQPDIVVPYTQRLIPLLSHKKTRVRWEAMHALSLIAAQIPETIKTLLPQLDTIIHTDKSTIVRDYATDTLSNYASTSNQAAKETYPFLKEALSLWNGKHVKQILQGFENIATLVPELHMEIRLYAQEYLEHRQGVVRKAAKRVLKAIEKYNG